VTTVHFDSAARFERDDLLLMSCGLRSVLDASMPQPLPMSVTDGVWGALGWLLAAAARGGLSAVERLLGSQSDSATAPDDANECRHALIDVATEELLDHAAALLDASVLLHGHGQHVHGFALEGIQGRLLEAAVGAGSVELP
jgi:hypothetical protein